MIFQKPFVFPPKRNLVEKIEVFHILADTYSTALKFIFISDPSNDVAEENFRDIIFEATVASKIYKRFDTSYECWDIFGSRKESRRKKLGYYKIGNIDNPCVVSLAVNPKEYLAMLKNSALNEKHKGNKKGSSGMGFENFSNRIKSLANFDTFEKPPAEYKEVSRFSVHQGEMFKKIVAKIKFSQLNGKRFYFADGIVSLPFDHKNLKEIDDLKQEKGQKIEKILLGRK